MHKGGHIMFESRAFHARPPLQSIITRGVFACLVILSAAAIAAVPNPIVTGPNRKAERRAGAAFGLSALAGLGLLVVYAAGGEVQLEGILLGVALGGIGAGLILWGKRLIPGGVVTEEREPHPSSEPQAEAAEETLEEGAEELGRRSFLVRMLVAAAGALGLAAIFPIRSLGPGPGGSLFRTAWRRGSRLVTSDGRPSSVVWPSSRHWRCEATRSAWLTSCSTSSTVSPVDRICGSIA